MAAYLDVLRQILQYVLLLGPPLVFVFYLIQAKSVTVFKLVALAALFIGVAVAYWQYKTMGLFGVVLAVTGLLFYLEEIRREMITEMHKLAMEDPGEWYEDHYDGQYHEHPHEGGQ